MVIRHVRRSESIIHNDLKQDTVNTQKEVVSQRDIVSLGSVNDILNEKDSDGSESGSESESESGSESGSEIESESDEEITYHKPILIRKTGSPKDSSTKKFSVSIEDIEKKRLNQRIEHSLTVTKNLSLNEINIDHNYTSTDKDLLKRTLLLNDDDTIDYDLEEKKWEDRQQLRLDRERKKLVQKQLEFEERQERLLKRSAASIKDKIEDDNDKTNRRPLNWTKVQESKNHFKRRKHFNSSKPQRVIDTTFNRDLPSSSLNKNIENGDNDNNNNNNNIGGAFSNVNEYSIL